MQRETVVDISFCLRYFNIHPASCPFNVKNQVRASDLFRIVLFLSSFIFIFYVLFLVFIFGSFWPIGLVPNPKTLTHFYQPMTSHQPNTTEAIPQNLPTLVHNPYALLTLRTPTPSLDKSYNFLATVPIKPLYPLTALPPASLEPHPQPPKFQLAKPQKTYTLQCLPSPLNTAHLCNLPSQITSLFSFQNSSEKPFPSTFST